MEDEDSITEEEIHKAFVPVMDMSIIQWYAVHLLKIRSAIY